MKKNFGKIIGLVAFFMLNAFTFADAATFYVSSSGTASNSGLTESLPTTLASVYAKADNDKEIIVLNDLTYTDATSAYSGKVTIKGKTASVNLTLPSTVSLKGDLEIDNVNLKTAATIYANGKHLKIGSNVTSTDRLTVYGGASSALTADTNIELLGGRYSKVFGGCKSATLSGSTNVIFGGNANPGDGINDSDKSTISPCYVYGGGDNGAVSEKTNVTLQDNAVAYFIVGTGAGASGALVNDTNIYIKGGKVMNVYGGSDSQNVSNCNAHITITGGMAEALFGGCQSRAFSGNTYINLFGGEVTRRVYTGCYNNVTTSGLSAKYDSDYYVTGNTTVTFAPGVMVNTKKELSSDNQSNMGVFSGSRTKSQHDAEQNTIIYLDNSYSTFKGTIGEKSLAGWFLGLKSFEDFIIKSGTGGKVYTTGTKGQLYIEPDKGNYGAIGSSYYINEVASVSSKTTDVTFAKNFAIDAVSADVSENGSVSGTVSLGAKNVKNADDPSVYVAIYDETGRFMGADFSKTTSNMTSFSFNIDGNFDSEKTYTLKTMLWDKALNPLIDENVITFQ